MAQIYIESAQVSDSISLSLNGCKEAEATSVLDICTHSQSTHLNNRLPSPPLFGIIININLEGGRDSPPSPHTPRSGPDLSISRNPPGMPG